MGAVGSVAHVEEVGMVWAKVVRRAACVGVIGALMAAMGPLGAAAAREATAGSRPAVSRLPLDFYELDGTTAVLTSGHVRRSLSVDVEYNPQGGRAAARPLTSGGSSADLSITLAAKGNTESNEWAFTLPGSAFSASPSKGTGHLSTRSKIAPYGVLDLTLKPIGKLHTHNVCAEERTTSRAVQLSGHLLVNTGPAAAHSLGKVGSLHHPFRFRAAITARYDKPNDDPKCDVSTDQPCPSAVTAEYNGPTQADGKSVGFSAFPHGSYDALTGYRDVTLSKPDGAQRVDEVTTRSDPMTITPQTQGTSVTVTANGPRAAGSATLAAGGEPTTYTPDYCKQPSSETLYSAALAPHPSLHFHNALGGTFAVPNVVSAGVYFTYQRR